MVTALPMVMAVPVVPTYILHYVVYMYVHEVKCIDSVEISYLADVCGTSTTHQSPLNFSTYMYTMPIMHTPLMQHISGLCMYAPQQTPYCCTPLMRHISGVCIYAPQQTPYCCKVFSINFLYLTLSLPTFLPYLLPLPPSLFISLLLSTPLLLPLPPSLLPSLSSPLPFPILISPHQDS